MLNRDIYDILLTELNMRDIFKMSLLSKLNNKIVEEYCQKLYLTRILDIGENSFTKYLCKNYTCYYCYSMLYPNNKDIVEGHLVCKECYYVELYSLRCDRCGERDSSKLKFRNRSTYCKDGASCKGRMLKNVKKSNL